MIFKDIAFFFDYSRPIGKQLVSSSNPTGGTLVMWPGIRPEQLW